VEEVIEKVVEKYLKMFVEFSECEKKKEELRAAFKIEFEVEPEVITPKEARRIIDLPENYREVIDDILEATNKIPANEDEHYTIELIAEFNEYNQKPHDWILKPGYTSPHLEKCTGDYVYYVYINVKTYDDC